MLLSRARSIEASIQQLKPKASQPRTPQLRGLNLPLMFNTSALSNCQEEVKESATSVAFPGFYAATSVTSDYNYIEDVSYLITS